MNTHPTPVSDLIIKQFRAGEAHSDGLILTIGHLELKLAAMTVQRDEARKDSIFWQSLADPRFARFGEAMWKYITKQGGDFCWSEDSEDILPLAQAAGLCCRVEYDPAIHGAVIEADLGDEIWWWGDFDWMNNQPTEP